MEDLGYVNLYQLEPENFDTSTRLSLLWTFIRPWQKALALSFVVLQIWIISVEYVN